MKGGCYGEIELIEGIREIMTKGEFLEKHFVAFLYSYLFGCLKNIEDGMFMIFAIIYALKIRGACIKIGGAMGISFLLSYACVVIILKLIFCMWLYLSQNCNYPMRVCHHQKGGDCWLY